MIDDFSCWNSTVVLVSLPFLLTMLGFGGAISRNSGFILTYSWQIILDLMFYSRWEVAVVQFRSFFIDPWL